MQFTDSCISDVEVGTNWDKYGAHSGVYFDVKNDDTGGISTGFFSKEELQELIKLIEETQCR